MISYSFGNLAFNNEYGENTIEMIVSAQNRYKTPEEFFRAAIRFLDEVVWTGYNVAAEYNSASLKDGNFGDIVQKWLNSMDEKVEINVDEIIKIYRVKRATYDPLVDEFLIETRNEYILLLWATSA